MTTQACGVFVVRIWLEPDGADATAWRASVTDTTTKEKRYFTEPVALSRFLLAMRPPGEAGAGPGPGA
jgi:hypothetical protein